MKFLKSEKYQPKAMEIFPSLKKQISSILETAQIEHIGSSAIQGALSKGDLDISVGVKADKFNQASEKLQGLGFKIRQDTFRSSELCMFEYFDYDLDVGIQLVDKNSKHTDFLIFRDALLKSPDHVAEYNKLKVASVNLTDAQWEKATCH